MDFFQFSWQLVVILLLVAANGFFVATEFAMVKVRASQLKPHAKSGDWRYAVAIKVTKRLDAFLSATQFGITLTSLGLGSLGEPYVTLWVQTPLEAMGIKDLPLIHTLSFILAFAVITFFLTVLGELGPKCIAIQHARTVTLWFTPILLVFYYIFFPFIWALNKTANWMLKLVGVRLISEGDGATMTQDELQHVLAHSHHVHPSDLLVNKIMLKALRLKDTTAEQVMVPHDRVTVLWRDEPVEKSMKVIQRTGYSRFPLCVTSSRRVVGMVMAKEFLMQYNVLGSQTQTSSILRPVLTFLPKTKLPTMLELFRKTRNHLAIVVDANDDMLGLVSFEDVLEELVGDIRDEFDIEKGPIYEMNAQMALVDGDMPIRDLAVETGWPLPMDSNTTVARWCKSIWPTNPAKMDQFDWEGGFRLIAEDISAHGLRRVRIIRRVDATDPENPSTPAEPIAESSTATVG